MKTRECRAVLVAVWLLLCLAVAMPAFAQDVSGGAAVPAPAVDWAAKVLLGAGIVASILQAVKKAIPQLQGWGARIVGFLGGMTTILLAAPAGHVLDLATISTAIITGFSAIGVHGLIKASGTQNSTIHPIP